MKSEFFFRQIQIIGISSAHRQSCIGGYRRQIFAAIYGNIADRCFFNCVSKNFAFGSFIHGKARAELIRKRFAFLSFFFLFGKITAQNI